MDEKDYQRLESWYYEMKRWVGKPADWNYDKAGYTLASRVLERLHWLDEFLNERRPPITAKDRKAKGD